MHKGAEGAARCVRRWFGALPLGRFDGQPRWTGAGGGGRARLRRARAARKRERGGEVGGGLQFARRVVRALPVSHHWWFGSARRLGLLHDWGVVAASAVPCLLARSHRAARFPGPSRISFCCGCDGCGWCSAAEDGIAEDAIAIIRRTARAVCYVFEFPVPSGHLVLFFFSPFCFPPEIRHA
ncbi:hypothetical protein SORBI_3003G358150 [Sorghum bicolor]|uniref:Uncharacterized protein n=1 Tax=Sorghum bicolor TaxID=4558 RepID=A0A1W0W0I3_SORBI|nr:hypothetical protein SORBI_3003G358150 [Sorghum bicolor]